MMENLEIRNAQIVNRNFAGKADKYNPNGTRQFSVRFNDKETIDKLIAAGWNISVKQFDEDDPNNVIGYLKVKVNFRNEKKPPIIKALSVRSDGTKIKTLIGEDKVATIDSADIENVKLVINPYEGVNLAGKPYVTGYLKTMHYTIVPDEFDNDDDEVGAVEALDDDIDLPFTAE